MKKKRALKVVSMGLLCTVLLSGCCIPHDWKEATCAEPQTCVKCGKTKGEPTEDHDWKEATCTEVKVCLVCDREEGEPLGHSWKEATCLEPKTCSVCEVTEGEPLGHTVKEWKETKAATCTEKGLEAGECTVCKEQLERDVKKKDHEPGKWAVVKKAEWNVAGEKEKKCKNCGEVLDTKEYELSDAEKESVFKGSCQSYTYEQIARDPDTYFLEHAVYTGKVVQVMQNGSDGNRYRVNITPTSWGGFEDTIYVEMPEYAVKRMPKRVLEDDIVTVWGYNFDTITYETVLDAKLTIPAVFGEYMEVVG